MKKALFTAHDLHLFHVFGGETIEEFTERMNFNHELFVNCFKLYMEVKSKGVTHNDENYQKAIIDYQLYKMGDNNNVN